MDETDGMYCWECGLDISESKQVKELKSAYDELKKEFERVGRDLIEMIQLRHQAINRADKLAEALDKTIIGFEMTSNRSEPEKYQFLYDKKQALAEYRGDNDTPDKT